MQAIASVDREEMFAEHMKERERRKRAEEKAARKRKLQNFRELLERTSDIKVQICTRTHNSRGTFTSAKDNEPEAFCTKSHGVMVVFHPSLSYVALINYCLRSAAL